MTLTLHSPNKPNPIKSGKSRPVAVSGVGIFCATGKDLPEFRTNLFKGACGINAVDLFDTTGYSCRVAAQITEPRLPERLPSRLTKRISRCDLLGLIAAREAIQNARIDFRKTDPDRIGVIMGGGAGGMLSWEKFRREIWQQRQKRFASRVLASAPCTLTDLIASYYGISGPRSTITTACSSSANAIGYGFDLIRSGRLDCVITGGSEALSELTFAGFHSLKVMSPEPCRPFDVNRQGLSLGEGAGIIVLEAYENAVTRGAAPMAMVGGYALNSDAYHMTSPDPKGMGMYRVMAAALNQAGTDMERVDYINAHGTATKINDKMESQAIGRVFGDAQLKRIWVSATKSMVGHCLGASGAIEAIATILAIDQETLPPTVHLDEIDPQCQLKHVTQTGIHYPIRAALSNSFAFGGNNTTLVFSRAGIGD